MNRTEKSYFDQCLKGLRLYGDDFSSDQVIEWFGDEKAGYFQIAGLSTQENYAYDYLNWFTLFRHLKKRHFSICLGVGSARGNDICVLAPQIDQFIIIEPSREYWGDSIGPVTAEYREPHVDGHIELPQSSVDLVVAIAVLHHIPNVSAVLAEIGRVLKPGGTFILREPISSMGDWRVPRPGLTKHERGLPRRWLIDALVRNGFVVEHQSYCMFSPIGAIWRKAPRFMPYNNRIVVLIDWLLSSISGPFARYHRTRPWQKIAPSNIAMVCRKSGG